MKLIASVAASLVLLSGMAYAQSKTTAPTKPADNARRAARGYNHKADRSRAEQASALSGLAASGGAAITDLIQRMTLDESWRCWAPIPPFRASASLERTMWRGCTDSRLGGPGGWGGRGLVTPTTQFPQSHGWARRGTPSC